MKTTKAKSGWLVVLFCCGASLMADLAVKAVGPAAWLAGAAALGQVASSGQDVDQLLKKARAAMKAGDIESAERWIGQAEKVGHKGGLRSPFADSPAKARRDLEHLKAARPGKDPQGRSPIQTPIGLPPLAGAPSEKGVTAVISDLPGAGPPAAGTGPAAHGPAAQMLPPVVDRSSPFSQISPLSQPADRLAESRKLLTEAQAALGRGDIQRADQLARQAMSLRVPDNLYGPQETRPYELLMEVNKQRQRLGIAGGVRPAQFSEDLEGAPTASPDAPPGDPAADSPPAPGAEALTPQQAVQRGDAALHERRMDEALQWYRRAWAGQGQLDPATRQRIQDQLQSLQAAERIPRPLDQSITQHDPQLQMLLQQVGQAEAEARRQLQRQPSEALRIAHGAIADVDASSIDDAAKQQLRARLDRLIREIDDYVEANRAKLELDEHNRAVLEEVDERRMMRLEIDKKLATMVDSFNRLMNQQRFAEAMVIAQQARDLDPNNPVVQNMLWKSRFAERLITSIQLGDEKAMGFDQSLSSVIESSAPFDDRVPYRFPRNWEDLNQMRQQSALGLAGDMDPAEREIYRTLREFKVQVNFEDRPLSEVIKTLGDLAGINIFLDPQGLAVEGLTSEERVTLNLPREISLQSALNLVLDPLRLSYMVQDEVLRITSRQASDANVRVVTYQVADLVIPIPNFIPTYHMGMAGALREAHMMLGNGGPGIFGAQAAMPLLADAQGTPSGGASIAAMALAQQRGGAGGTFPVSPMASPPAMGMGPGGLGGGAAADFTSLIDLIQNTIEPESWLAAGGTGSIEQYAGNLSIVVNNTQEVHDKIRDLLEQLRLLQDLQVTIEVRFLTLNDNFFERIGVDFDFDIDDNVPGGVLPPDDGGPSVTIGLDPVSGEPTADLDISFTQGGFESAIPPPFSGFDPATAASLGFAILSDIEAFFVIQAAQGDSRTNILQAPKVTLFNGQFAFVTDSTQRAFVSSVIPVVGDFAVAHQPVVMVLNEGTSLSVQAVVSHDRRFVRLTLVPMFSRINDVQEFTFSGSKTSDTGTTAVDPSDDNRTVQNDATETTEGVTIQLPTFSFTNVSTTVSVPDGGTVLMGGIKRMSEGRNERGVPVLSKLPFINRLFKNVGIGRTTQSLMMMVTPRIIIQEEEEAKMGLPGPPPPTP